MLFVAAVAVPPRRRRADVGSIEAAHAGLARLVGGGAALAFAVALLASGLSSSSVGTYAGQVVMQGFIRRRDPAVRPPRGDHAPGAGRCSALGLPVTASLVLSQVVLSFGIPFALVPLLLLTRRRDIMGALVNRRLTTVTTGVVTALIIVLNVVPAEADLHRLITRGPAESREPGRSHHIPPGVLPSLGTEGGTNLLRQYRRVSIGTVPDVTSEFWGRLDDGGLPVLARTGEGDGLGGRCRGVGGAVRRRGGIQ